MNDNPQNKKHFWYKTFRILRNKYVVTILLFTLWITFGDQNRLIDRYDNIQQLNHLKQQKEYYIQKIKEDQMHMQELISNKENLEKFARENYLMKKDNEDVFFVITE